MPSPTYQWTKARLAYMRSNLPKSSSSPSPSAVSAPTSSKSFSRAARSSRASENSPSSIPSPTYQCTKARLAYMRSNLWSIRDRASATAAFTSLGTTSPRYIRHTAMYLPWRGSHLVSMEAGSNTELVISLTDSCSWYAFSAEMIGAYDASMKWIRGYGTKLVWNSVMSTFKAPSKRREAVKEDVI